MSLKNLKRFQMKVDMKKCRFLKIQKLASKFPIFASDFFESKI
jgi:hypothetical protein